MRDFVPLVPGKVSVYGCGLTVQGAPHVGHIRFGLVFDVLTRWLEYRGFEVTYCRNVTDIDDKILRKAAERDVEYWRVASRYEREATAAYELIGCRPPTVEPRATGHIPEMIAMTAALIERGHAYAANGDVYFDVNSFPEYGALSNQRLTEMLSADDADPKNAKRDPRDFTLWKGAKPGGEPFWESQPGQGRPGWHLECSAMTHKYLGESFDIHGGRARPDLPAPRERDRPVQGLRRRVRAVLAAQRVGDPGGREDVEVAGQLDAGRGGGAAAPSGRAALLPRLPALPLHDRVLGRGDRRGGRRVRQGSSSSSPGRSS